MNGAAAVRRWRYGGGRTPGRRRIRAASLRTLRLGTGPLPARSPGWALMAPRVPAGYAAACAVREAVPPGDSRPTRPSASSVRQHR
ncbi:hypothetical protein YWIDRAFT_04849 [Streptomyces sp. SceaMP-e96]|nr:hypothetical protein YWIDRAFT_04849 [Streptomyces sp. SceaMP-e96]